MKVDENSLESIRVRRPEEIKRNHFYRLYALRASDPVGSSRLIKVTQLPLPQDKGPNKTIRYVDWESCYDLDPKHPLYRTESLKYADIGLLNDIFEPKPSQMFLTKCPAVAKFD
jgi:hypothetical protein